MAKKLERYFLDTDWNSHWYLVPTSKRKQWEMMTVDDPSDDDQDFFDKFDDLFKEHMLGHHPSMIEFENPKTV